jgi:hypothetical protein
MAKLGFNVIDSDIHVVEPKDLWLRYLEPEFVKDGRPDEVVDTIGTLGDDNIVISTDWPHGDSFFPQIHRQEALPGIEHIL